MSDIPTLIADIQATVSTDVPTIEVDVQLSFLKGEKGDPGNSPRIGENGNWETYDNASQNWTDTGTHAQGPTGPQGLQGDTGETGEPGKTGPKGDKGDVYVPSLTDDGLLSWELNGETEPQPVNIRGPQGLQGLPGDKGEPGDKGDQGDKGNPGPQGDPGKSAFEIAQEQNPDFTDVDTWLASLKGEAGTPGKNGDRGEQGEPGTTWVPSVDADTGLLTWVENGEAPPEPVNIRGPKGEPGETAAKGDPGDTYVPSVSPEGLLTWEKNGDTEPQPVNIKGKPGEKGSNGLDGDPGADGKSAYELALEQDPQIGDLQTWLASLKGEKGENGADGTEGPAGADGKSAFEIAQELHPEFTDEETWLASLKGDKGEPGDAAELPIASASVLGGIKVGTGLSITTAGVLSAQSDGAPAEHQHDVLNPTSVTSDNVATVAGTRALKWTGLSGEHAVLQVDVGNEKWQLMNDPTTGPYGETFSYRFNKNGGTDSSGWGGWYSLLDGNNYKNVITPNAIGAAASAHKHSAADITSGILSVTYGGTGKINLTTVYNVVSGGELENWPPEQYGGSSSGAKCYTAVLLFNGTISGAETTIGTLQHTAETLISITGYIQHTTHGMYPIPFIDPAGLQYSCSAYIKNDDKTVSLIAGDAWQNSKAIPHKGKQLRKVTKCDIIEV